MVFFIVQTLVMIVQCILITKSRPMPGLRRCELLTRATLLLFRRNFRPRTCNVHYLKPLKDGNYSFFLFRLVDFPFFGLKCHEKNEARARIMDYFYYYLNQNEKKQRLVSCVSLLIPFMENEVTVLANLQWKSFMVTSRLGVGALQRELIFFFLLFCKFISQHEIVAQQRNICIHGQW